MVIRNICQRVKLGSRWSKWSPFVLYLIVWAVAVTIFWFFTDGSDALGYNLMFLWVLLPIATFACSVPIGKNDCQRAFKWFMVILFGVLYMLAEYGTFGLAHMIGTGKLLLPEFMMILYGMAFSFAGLAVGTAIRWYKGRR